MLKKILIFFTILYIVPVAFYFYGVLPECLACNENTPTSLEVTDFGEMPCSALAMIGNSLQSFTSFT